ncbi:hypothetical protein ACFCP7_27585 [Paenibacillus elgii]
MGAWQLQASAIGTARQPFGSSTSFRPLCGDGFGFYSSPNV